MKDHLLVTSISGKPSMRCCTVELCTLTTCCKPDVFSTRYMKLEKAKMTNKKNGANTTSELKTMIAAVTEKSFN